MILEISQRSRKLEKDTKNFGLSDNLGEALGIRQAINLLATRISSLSPRNQDEGVLRNFTFGAIYAVGKATTLEYPSQMKDRRKWRAISNEITYLGTAMAKGKLPEKGNWLTGFYLNDAVFRIDAGFEHITRHITGRHHDKKVKGPLLKKLAIGVGLPSQFLEPWLEKIRREDNLLKHETLLGEAPISDKELMKAIENLVRSVEWVFGRELPPTVSYRYEENYHTESKE